MHGCGTLVARSLAPPVRPTNQCDRPTASPTDRPTARLTERPTDRLTARPRTRPHASHKKTSDADGGGECQPEWPESARLGESEVSVRMHSSTCAVCRRWYAAQHVRYVKGAHGQRRAIMRGVWGCARERVLGSAKRPTSSMCGCRNSLRMVPRPFRSAHAHTSK